jgi:tetrahydromethanopterin S-methyltransferase subunit B
MTYIKVKDNEHLLRDATSNGIINDNTEEYRNYVNAYLRQINSKTKMDELQNQVDDVRNDVKEIKELIKKLLNS